MKGSMKKLVVFVVIAIMATFLSVAMALAFDKYKNSGKDSKAIHGEYAATAFSSCIGTPYGFVPGTPIPNPPSTAVFNNTATSKAIWTFNSDGTGEVETRSVGINFSMYANSSDLLGQFTYEVTDDGMITIVWGTLVGTYLTGPAPGATYTVSGMVPEEGYVSSDHKTITLGSVTTGVITLTIQGLLYPLYAICNYSRVLIRVGN